MVRSPYNETFYADILGGSRRSARRIVPTVVDLVVPRSVIDVGCGAGTWLDAFREAGVDDLMGIDGARVDDDLLQVPRELVTVADLRRPLAVTRRFDLAICLEVAEHLPARAAADFVAGLAALAPVVLFSAAVPYQGGTGHVNEQWPSYWQAHFDDHDFVVVDCLRPRFWDDEEVTPLYAQNVLLLVHREHLAIQPTLLREYEQTRGQPLDLVHPRIFAKKMRHPLLVWIAGKLPDRVKNRVTAPMRRYVRTMR